MKKNKQEIIDKLTKEYKNYRVYQGRKFFSSSCQYEDEGRILIKLMEDLCEGSSNAMVIFRFERAWKEITNLASSGNLEQLKKRAATLILLKDVIAQVNSPLSFQQQSQQIGNQGIRLAN